MDVLSEYKLGQTKTLDSAIVIPLTVLTNNQHAAEFLQ